MNNYSQLLEDLKSRYKKVKFINLSDKPELNVKIANINSKLKVLYMENGFDFIENNNRL